MRLLALLLVLAPSASAAQQSLPPANMDMEKVGSQAAVPDWGALQPNVPYVISRDVVSPFQGTASARLQSTKAVGIDEFGTVAKTIDAKPFRGKKIRLRAAVRTQLATPNFAGLWMRVNVGTTLSFFDNMADRPIRDPNWKTYEIVGDVAHDADQIAFGVLLAGTGVAWLDDVSIAVVGDAKPASLQKLKPFRSILRAAGPTRGSSIIGDVPARPLTPQGARNLTSLARVFGHLAHFNATDQAAAADWPAVAIDAVERVEGASDPAALALALNNALRPYAPDFCAYVGNTPPCETVRPVEATGAVTWKHLGRQLSSDNVYRSDRIGTPAVATEHLLTVELGNDVRARVPIAAWVNGAGKTLLEPPTSTPPSKPNGWTPAGFDRSTRLADVIVAWNVFQHFYPYFDVVKADWPTVLQSSLKSAATDRDDRAFVTTLEKMVAQLEDGHGDVIYTPRPTGRLPLSWDWIENQLVVTAVGPATGELRVGDIIEEIDGTPASKSIFLKANQRSGSSHWRLHRALEALSGRKVGDVATLKYRRGKMRGTVILVAGSTRTPEHRPDTLTEIRPNILYVDLTRTSGEEVIAAANRLAQAKGIVFDVRGYPKGTPTFMSYMSSTPFKSMPMRVPIISRPDRKEWQFEEGAWKMAPLQPRFAGRIMFLTDKRAISFSESILGTVKHAKLGTIVGEPTAGANGNINTLPLPGGYALVWTGMQVLSANGGVHHTVGVAPDLVIKRTVAGVKAGRDEVLDEALRLILTQ